MGTPHAMTLDDLMQRLWPGGSTDRFDPSAVEWLRRWGPVRQVATPPAGSSCN